MGSILKVTMADVARRAQVSQATVSLALREHPSIPGVTRARIARTAGELGYRRHAGISDLMARIRTRRPLREGERLAALTSWPDPRRFRDVRTWAHYFDGATRRAQELGYRLDDYWLGDPKLPPARVGQILRSRGIEGVLVFPLGTPGAIELDWSTFAAVAIGYTLLTPKLHRTSTSHYDAVTTARTQLHARGYRRIGLAVNLALNDRMQRKWLAAFAAYEYPHAAGHLRDSVVLLEEGDERRFSAWVRRFRPDAILFDSAVPAHTWMKRLKDRAAREIALASLSEQWLDAGCAWIDERSADVGAAAVDLVVSQLQRNERGIPPFQRELFITGEWREGAPVAASH